MNAAMQKKKFRLKEVLMYEGCISHMLFENNNPYFSSFSVCHRKRGNPSVDTTFVNLLTPS